MNKKLSIFLIVIFVFIGFLGYWELIRPSAIRSDCYKKVKERIDAPGEITVTQANNTYRLCLASKGMKPEDIATK